MKHLLIVLILSVTLIGCGERSPKPSPMFYQGQIVKSVIDGQRGQITHVNCRAGDRVCRYNVRFKSMEGDKWGRAYSNVFMKEFELEKVR